MPGLRGPTVSKVAPRATRNKPPPRGVIGSLRTVVGRLCSTPGDGTGENAPRRFDNTHLAFGDAQTVAMLDLAVDRDKERWHFTGQKCLARYPNPV
jgi:hypothetical protein